MRVWDLSPAILCRQHLLGEHREIHAVWAILTLGKRGYANHPETRRWRGKERALFLRHERIVAEMLARGYRHNTPLDPAAAGGLDVQDEYVDPPEEQVEILRRKKCGCQV